MKIKMWLTKLFTFLKQHLSVKMSLIILAVLAVWIFIHHQKSIESNYKTQPVEKGDITQMVSANGTLNPVVVVSVGTQVSGTVKKLYADFNDQVKQDQLLVELDPDLLQAQVNQSEASVTNAKANLDLAEANEKRARELYQDKYVSKQDIDQSTQALKSARAQLTLAQAQAAKDHTNLNYTKIRSPVSGVVIDRQIDVGQTVAASFQTPTLFKIAQDLSKMQIDTSFAEADVGNIKEGQPAAFTVDAFPSKSFKGVVKQVRLNPTTQQNVVTYDVVIAVDNPDQVLMPGMTAYVNIITAEHKNVLIVPNAALRYKPKEEAAHTKQYQKPGAPKERKETVYTLKHGNVTPVSVKTGIADKQVTEIISDELTTDDNVIVEESTSKDAANSSSSNFKMRLF